LFFVTEILRLRLFQAKTTFSVQSKQKQMKSKQYPYGVNVLRKRVNLSSESGQLYSGEAVNRIRTGRQMLKNKA